MTNAINNFVLKLLEPILRKKLHTVSTAFQNGKYNNILRIYDVPYSGAQASTVYGNVFRILCLINTNDKKWKSEYLTLEQSSQLKNLGANDEKYLKKVIVSLLSDKHESWSDLKGLDYYDYDESKISKLTLKLFPLNVMIA